MSRKFENKVKEIIHIFLAEMYDFEEMKDGFDIDELIWDNKEIFGISAYGVINEYFGNELQEIADQKFEELKLDNNDEGNE